jgi:hypothetical protein
MKIFDDKTQAFFSLEVSKKISFCDGCWVWKCKGGFKTFFIKMIVGLMFGPMGDDKTVPLLAFIFKK